MLRVILILFALCLPLCAQSVEELKQQLSVAADSQKLDLLVQLTTQLKSQDPKMAVAYGELAFDYLANAPQPEVKIELLKSMSWALMRLGRYPEAHKASRQGRALAEAMNDFISVAKFFNTEASIYNYLGNHDQALPAYLSAYEIYRDQGENRSAALVLQNTAMIYHVKGDYLQALERYRQALDVVEREGNVQWITPIVSNIGSIYLDAGEYRQARHYFERSLALAQEGEDVAKTAVSYHNLGRSYQGENKNRRALTYFQEAQALYEDLNDPASLSKVHLAQGVSYLDMAEYQSAHDMFSRSLEIKQRLNNQLEIANANHYLGIALLELKRYSEAMKVLNLGLATYVREDQVEGRIKGLLALGRLDKEQRRFDSALNHVGQALALAEDRTDGPMTLECYLAASDIHIDQGDYPMALEFYRKYQQKSDLFLAEAERNRIGVELLRKEYEIQKMNAEKRNGEMALLRKDMEIRELESKRRSMMRSISLGALGTVFLLVIILLIRYNERKALAQEQRVVERLQHLDRLKDEFLANTSHELFTPLNGIIGLAESLHDGVAGMLPAKARGDLALIVHNGRRLTDMVTDLLDFSRLKNENLELQLKPVDLRSLTDLVLIIVQNLARSKNLELVNAITPEIPPLYADENRLQQVLLNLVDNAIKFSDQGVVKVTAEMVGAMVRVHVADQGVGIPGYRLKHIFTPFEQLDGSGKRLQSGAGLGLAIAHKLVLKHGGTLTAESTPGTGSTFSFTLPVADLDSAVVFTDTDSSEVLAPQPWVGTETHVPVVNEEEQHHRFNILIVDDEPVNRQLLVNHLALERYVIHQVENGPDCLAFVDSGETVDLILLDVMMPGMTGLEVCREIRKSHPVHELPIIFLTARGQSEDLVTGFNAGANDYLTKPLVRNELIARVRTHIQLLDTNRTLEQKVSERTLELNSKNLLLSDKNRELETLDSIVKTINRKIRLEDVFQTLLEQSMLLFRKAHKGAVLLLDKEAGHFHFTAAVGFKLDPLVDLVFQPEEVLFRFAAAEHEIEKGIYLYEQGLKLKGLPHNQSVLSTAVHFGEELEALLLLFIRDGVEVFNKADGRRLDRFREHAQVAVAKAQYLQELNEKNKAIVKAQNQLVLREKMAGVGVLTAGVAHEINNPCNYTLGSAQNLEADLVQFRDFLRELAGDQAEREILEAFDQRFGKMFGDLGLIKRGVDRIQNIVSDLHNFSRLDEAEWKSTDLIEGLMSTINLIRPHYLDQIHFELQGEAVAEVECNPAEINQVFMNILVNGCQAVMERISRDDNAPTGRIIIRVRLEENQVSIEFADNGIGISSKLQEKIFEAFYSTKPVGQGTGLGLYTCYNIVHKHGGNILVKSTEGQGAAFTLVLPVRGTGPSKRVVEKQETTSG